MLGWIPHVFCRGQKLQRPDEPEGGTNTWLPVLSLTLERYHCPLWPDFLSCEFYHTLRGKMEQAREEKHRLLISFICCPDIELSPVLALLGHSRFCFSLAARNMPSSTPPVWLEAARRPTGHSIFITAEAPERRRKRKKARQRIEGTHLTGESHRTLWTSDGVFLKASRDAFVRWGLDYTPQLLALLLLVYQSSFGGDGAKTHFNKSL